MSTTEQKALELADRLQQDFNSEYINWVNVVEAVTELRRLSAENEALRAREGGLIRAVAECRDLFPMPEPGAELEFIWGQAMGDPESVPGYVKAQVDTLRAQVEALTVDNKELRRHLCAARAGYRAYMDDGEAQDNSVHPCIDYLRDSLKDINAKMLERMQNPTPSPLTRPAVAAELAGHFREALAWGKVYGARMELELWDEMRERMVLEFTRRAAAPQPEAHADCPDCKGSEFKGFKRGMRCTSCDGTGQAHQPEAQPTDPHANCPAPVDDIEAAEREHMGCAHCKTGIYAEAQPTEAAQPTDWRAAFDVWWSESRVKTHNLRSAEGFSRKAFHAGVLTAQKGGV